MIFFSCQTFIFSHAELRNPQGLSEKNVFSKHHDIITVIVFNRFVLKMRALSHL